MTNGYRILTGLLFCLVAAPAILSAQPDTTKTKSTDECKGRVSSEMVHEDPRLGSKITVSFPRVTIGELLEKLSQSTSISLSAGEHDGAADICVAVFCKDVPLVKILNGVWAAVSYRPAPWEWKRAALQGAYRYRLVQPSGAYRLREQIRGWLQNRMEQNARTLIGAIDGDRDDRERAFRQVFGTGDVNQLYASTRQQIWMAVRGFRDSLSSAQQLEVLRGRQSVEIPFEALGSTTRSHFLSEWREVTKDTRSFSLGNDGALVESPLKPPNAVRFERFDYGSVWDIGVLMPQHGAATGFGGLALEKRYRQYLHGIWILDDDSVTDVGATRIMAMPESAAAEPPSPPAPLQIDPSNPPTVEELRRMEADRLRFGPPEPALQQLSRRLEQLSCGSHVPVVARLPEEDGGNVWLSVPWNHTLKDYWKQLWNKSLMVKWHDGVQIVSTEIWPREDPPVPLWLLRNLRKHSDTGNLIPFESLCASAALLSKRQLLRLKPEFPVMEAVVRSQDVLALLHRNPELAKRAQQPSGVRLNTAILKALRTALPTQLLTRLESGEAQFLVIEMRFGTDPNVPWREVIFWLQNEHGKRLQGFSFVENARTTHQNP